MNFHKYALSTPERQGHKYILLLYIFVVIILSSVSIGRTQAANYYWVGGSGDWSDINHWVTTSGGNVNYTLVPTAYDDVYFDNNSFTGPNQKVMINAANYVCHNMFWTVTANNPTFTNISNYGLRVFGSFKLCPSMIYNISGEIQFSSTNLNNSIDLAGQHFNNSISFDGAGGGWNLYSTLDVSSFTIYLKQGQLNTNNQLVRCGAFYSLFAQPRTLLLGNSLVKVGGGWSMDATQLTMDAGSSVILMTSSTATFDNRGGALNYHNVLFTDTTGMAVMMAPVNNPVNFNQVTFHNKAYIYGAYSFNVLALLNKYYELRANDTISIIQNLITAGDCKSSVLIRSSVDSVLTYIQKPSGSITVNYVLLQDVAALGSSPFIANNAIDLGNNPGWILSSPAPQNLYWVSGTGKWDDPAHWSYTSGGAGGACVPTPLDNVFFDAHSFDSTGQYVLINGFNSYCHNINWTGVTNMPTLQGSYPNSLNIFGSMVNSVNMIFNFSGYTLFRAQDSGNIIITAGHPFLNNITFKGHQGFWEFMDDFNAGSNLIYLEKGHINTHGVTVNCASFYSAYTHDRGLTLCNSIFNVHGTHPNAWMVCKTHLDFDAGTSTINFTGAYGGMLNLSGDTMRFYHVNFVHPSGCASLSTTSLIATFQRVQFINNGSIAGDNIYDTLNLNNSFYRLNANSHQTIRKQLTNGGNCSQYTYIFSSDESIPAYLKKNQGAVILNYALLHNIYVSGGATFTAQLSVDMGNNVGWMITTNTPRDLYWVGGSGSWNEASHWSLTSGGVGGECVPNPTDNVIFDSASFDHNGETAYIGSFYAFCHDMTWDNVAYQPTFAGMGANSLMIYGSLQLCTNMHYLNEGNIYFLANDAGNTVTTASLTLCSQLIFNGDQGEWSLNDNLHLSKALYLYRGKLATNDYDLICNSFISIYPFNRTFSLGHSNIQFTANDVTAWYVVPQNLNLQAGTSTITFPGANGGMTNSGAGSLTFHNVYFTDSLACSEIKNIYSTCNYNRVFFRSNGKIWGANTFDTLSFFPAKTYTMESGLTQTINKKLDLCGNGCFPITLKSSQPGSPSTFLKSTGTVSAAYVEMHDQQAIGGATFYAGNYSTNISGNSGWIFGTGPGYVFGLVDNAYICPGDTLNIDTYNFIGGVSFQWQDGFEGPVYAATHQGTYTVHVTYADLCYLTDTINLHFNAPASASSSNDTSVCPGSPVSILVKGPSNSTYLWSNGSVQPSILVSPTQTTTYSVSVTNICGMATAQTTVTTYDLPFAEAGQNESICPGTQTQLTASGLPGSSFQWSNNTSDAQTTVAPTSTTSYVVTVTDPHQCGTATDVVSVNVYPSAFATIGNDTTLCQGQSVTLIAQGLADSYWYWSNGNNHISTTIQPTNDTVLWVTAIDSHHCGSATDSISIHVVDMPAVWSNNDTIVCPGSPVQLTANGNYIDGYLWSTGSSDQSIAVYPEASSTYEVQAYNQCGTVTEQIVVNMHPTPLLAAAITEETCGRRDGSITLTGGTSYLWNTGETSNVLSPVAAGTYDVTVSNQWCSISSSYIVNEIAGPVAAFTANADYLYESQNFIFTDASENAVSWSWDFGDQHGQNGETQVSHLYENTGVYTVSLIVSDEHSCTDTAKIQVTMEYPELFYMPNAFTPNDDGLNESFGPAWRLPERVSNYSMTIYNRWGEEIFTTHDLQRGWDGFSRNQMSVDGVYTWQIHLTEAPGLLKEYTGQVVLLH